MTPAPLTRSLAAKILGAGAGLGALFSAGVHQGFGGPEVHETLARAQGDVPSLFLVQLEAVWIAGTAAFALIGAGLIVAALRRVGWLYSLGWAAAIWFGATALAFVWSGPRWGHTGLAPQAVLLALIAGLAAGAAILSAPKKG